MSSIQSVFSQPKTRSLVGVSASSYFMPDAGVTALLAPAATVSSVGSLYTFTTAAAFKTAFTLNATVGGATGTVLVVGETLLDLGHEIVGTVVGMDVILKLRRVKRGNLSGVGAGADLPTYATGWVVVENNVSQNTTFSAASSRVGVARV